MIEQSVDDVMTRTVHTIDAEATACEVARLFAEHDIGSAWSSTRRPTTSPES